MKKIIAIDGPSGSGKSTLAREMAKKLKWVYVDTGAMYRAITWLCLERGIDAADKEAICALLKDIDILFVNKGDSQDVIIANSDVTKVIRTKKITSSVSMYAANEKIREKVTQLVREMGHKGSIVLDGRDIGTVVFPDAAVKLFLLASSTVRAERRLKEMREEATLEEVRLAIEERDKVDSERACSPLCKADDAIEINTADYTIEEMTKKALELASAVI